MKLTDTGLPEQLAREMLPPGTDKKEIDLLTERLDWAWRETKEIPSVLVYDKETEYNHFTRQPTTRTYQRYKIRMGVAAEWARRNGFPVRPEILERLPPDSSQSPPPGNGDNAGDDKEIDPRQRKTYLRVIGALLKDGYGMDIHAKKIEGVTDLLNDLTNQGAEISERTLRDIIKAAAELLPPIEKPRKS